MSTRNTAPGAFLQRHRTVASLVLAVGLPLVLLGALEGGLRLIRRHQPTRLFLPVEGTDLYGANRKFGWRFFPRAVARKPLAQAFVMPKPEGTCRIFVLGASAAMGVPNSAFSFGQQLDVMLSARHRGVRFEVVNTAITAINSHVVLPIARECAAYEPDLYVVYLGNNEVIGPFGIGSSRGATAPPLTAIRAGVGLRATAIGQLLQSAGARLRGEDDVLREWGGMTQYAHNMVAAGDPVLDRINGNFRRNLEDICAAGTGAGAQVVLSTVAVNLKDSAPFASVGDSLLAPGERRAWREALADGVAAAAAGRLPEARDRLQRAAAVLPTHAATRYRLGRVLLALGDTAAAAPHFAAALEHDALRFRTDRRRNAVIRETATADGVHLVDAVAALRDHEPSGTGLPGDELFYEHVHLNFAGNHLLARALLPAVEAALPEWVRRRRLPAADVPDVAACRTALAFTPWNAFNNWRQIRSMVVRYPFTAQVGHAEFLAGIDERLDGLRLAADDAQVRATLAEYDAAVRRRPNDLLMALNFAKLLAQTGNEAAAGRILDQVLATQPAMPDLDALEWEQVTGGG
jgi:tetratricopeptide (TPR) repeat protein